MGNPHAVWIVDDVNAAPVAELGPQIEHHPRFPQRVNVGFMQIVNREQIRLRVFERGSGETLACGTGACAAVVAGITRGPAGAGQRRDARRRTGHRLGGRGQSGVLTGPAVTVFHGEIEIQ
jgi:diaminopimelate epimerase